MDPSSISFLSFRLIFHVHDCGTKGKDTSQKKKTKGGGVDFGGISAEVPYKIKNIATLSHSLHLFQAQASSGSYPTSYPPRLSMSDDQMECEYVA